MPWLDRSGAITVRLILTAVILATLTPLVLAWGYSLLRFAGEEKRSYEQQALRIATRTALAIDRDLDHVERAILALSGPGEAPLAREVEALEGQLGGTLAIQPGVCRDAPYASNLRRRPFAHVVVCVPGRPDVAALIPAETLGRNLLNAGADERWTLSIVDNADRVVWRSRDAVSHLGDLATDDLRENAVGSSGLWRGTTLEGTDVVAAYARSRKSDFRVAVGAPVAMVEAPMRRSVAIFTGAGLLAMLASLAAGWLVSGLLVRPLRSLAEAGERLGDGREARAPRTRIREIAAVTTAFEEATRRLEANAAEKERMLAQLAESRQHYADLLDHMPVAIVQTDAEGAWVYANLATERLLDLEPSSVLGRAYDAQAWSIAAADGSPVPAADLPTARALRGEAVIGQEHAIRHPVTKKRVLLSVNAVPLKDPDGRITGSIAALTDVTARQIAQRALSRAEKRLRATNEHAGVGIAELGPDGVFTSVNGAMRALTGYPDKELIGLPLSALVNGGSDLIDAFLAGARQNEHGEHLTAEFELTTLQGRTIATDIMVSWVESDGDSGGFFVAVMQDVTEEKRALDRQKLLIDELNHRVKNMLTTVLSLSVQTARSSPGIAEFRQRFESRLHALAITHDLLTRERWEGAGLREVLKAEFTPYADPDEPDSRIQLDGPPVRLSPGSAVSFSLVVHELVTNAVKYGALRSPSSGRLSLGWEIVDDWIELDWIEEADAEVEEPTSVGFGSRLIDQVLKTDLRGTIVRRYERQGLVARLRFRSDNGR